MLLNLFISEGDIYETDKNSQFRNPEKNSCQYDNRKLENRSPYRVQLRAGGLQIHGKSEGAQRFG